MNLYVKAVTIALVCLVPVLTLAQTQSTHSNPSAASEVDSAQNTTPAVVSAPSTLDAGYLDHSVNLSEYGGSVSIGVALGGGGIIGLPVRIYPTEMFSIEAGLYYRPEMVFDAYGGFAGGHGIMLAGGLNVYFNKRYVSGPRKIRSDGIFIKGGWGSSENLNSSFVGAGWAREMMHEGNTTYSFSFELGPGVMFNSVKEDNVFFDQEIEVSETAFLLYWKIHWGWALGSHAV